MSELRCDCCGEKIIREKAVAVRWNEGGYTYPPWRLCGQEWCTRLCTEIGDDLAELGFSLSQVLGESE